jgi:hypothetical protein
VFEIHRKTPGRFGHKVVSRSSAEDGATAPTPGREGSFARWTAHVRTADVECGPLARFGRERTSSSIGPFKGREHVRDEQIADRSLDSAEIGSETRVRASKSPPGSVAGKLVSQGSTEDGATPRTGSRSAAAARPTRMATVGVPARERISSRKGPRSSCLLVIAGRLVHRVGAGLEPRGVCDIAGGFRLRRMSSPENNCAHRGGSAGALKRGYVVMF